MKNMKKTLIAAAVAGLLSVGSNVFADAVRDYQDAATAAWNTYMEVYTPKLEAVNKASKVDDAFADMTNALKNACTKEGDAFEKVANIDYNPNALSASNAAITTASQAFADCNEKATKTYGDTYTAWMEKDENVGALAVYNKKVAELVKDPEVQAASDAHTAAIRKANDDYQAAFQAEVEGQ